MFMASGNGFVSTDTYEWAYVIKEILLCFLLKQQENKEGFSHDS